ncbi:MAG TPA: tetratricopeptide repeat protein [Chthoniobacterales bacterium]|nr:tetratricopeptide repeat protein [Chthoniobacterales bacterium]
MSRKKKTRSTASRRKISEETRRPFPWIWALLLVVATVAAYQPAWRAGFIWDDDVYVTANRLLTAPDGLQQIWFSLESPSQYFPLVYTTFRLEHALWGLNAAGYHWVNILLHAANALLLWQLLRWLRVPGAWFAAALFALHPVQVESVAWITERKNVLMGFFFLLALLCWTAFCDPRSHNKWRWYALAIGCYALALFSKTTACTLPAALLLILWLKHEPIIWRRIAQVVPFVVLGIAMGLVTIWWERYHQGTQGMLFAIGVPERFLIAGRAFWFYLGKLIWPAHLSFSYPHWEISATHPADYIWLAAIAALAVAIYFGRRWVGRSAEVALLFFGTTLGPVLGFIMLYTFRYSFVADHYQYLASIGPLALVAAGTTTAFNFLRREQRFLQPAICGAILLLLGIRTWQQGGVYSNHETLWRAVLAENSGSWMAHNNLGIVLAQSGWLDEAVEHYHKALELNPGYAEAYYNLANALLRAQRVDEAIALYKKALELEPRMSTAHGNLGAIFQRRGELDEAIAHFEKAVEIDNGNAAYHALLADALRRAGREEEAQFHLRKAAELDPRYANSR